LGLIDDDPIAAAADGDSAMGGVSTGTTMVAAKYKDGVVIGADSRSVKSKFEEVLRAPTFFIHPNPQPTQNTYTDGR
jgi:hypothetical protein